MTKTIGLIGAGHIGSQIARLAVSHGFDVVISNSRGPETLAPLVAELGPRARAATPVDAARAGDIVVVTIPLKNYRDVPVAPLAGKIVIDTNNYYPQRDGHIPELDNESTTTAELLQAHLPTSRRSTIFTPRSSPPMVSPPVRRTAARSLSRVTTRTPRRRLRSCSTRSASTRSMPGR
jgi:predicted dinucleotide-binding enzyme